MVIALAIAIHNIPEGICTSAPYYYASRKPTMFFFMFGIVAVMLLDLLV